MDHEYIMVLTTTADEEEAEKISNQLIEKKLGACVQIYGPIKSTYTWEGEIVVSKEWMCFVKTRSENFEDIKRKIKDIHSYENPEIIAIPIIDGSQEYLKWIQNEVS